MATFIFSLISFSIFWMIDRLFSHPLSYIAFPVLAVSVLFYKYREYFFPSSHIQKIARVSLLLGILLLPYAATYFAYNNQLSTIENQSNDREKIEVISKFVLNSHTPFWGDFGKIFYAPLRANDDFLKFLVLGVAGCGDMAFSTCNYLDFLEMDSRVVGFSGEDHALAEVYYENEWMVIDPGYSYTLITQQQRGQKRVEEMGGLSYVVTKYNNTKVDLTKKYVPTDQVTIKVIENDFAVPNASVSLKHKFLGSNRSLPCRSDDQRKGNSKLFS
jgi:hypothetical protein